VGLQHLHTKTGDFRKCTSRSPISFKSSRENGQQNLLLRQFQNSVKNQLGNEWRLVKRKCRELRTKLSAKIGSCTERNLQRNWVYEDLKMTLEAKLQWFQVLQMRYRGSREIGLKLLVLRSWKSFLSPKESSGEIEFKLRLELFN